MSPRVWLYQVPDTSFPVSSFGLSSPFSRLLAKSLKVSHWPRPPVPPPQNLKTLGVWRFCPGPQCTCTLLASSAPWSTDFTQYDKQCSLLLCMHTHMHIRAHTDPEHMHTCVCTCTYWSVYIHTHTHTHTHTSTPEQCHGSPLPLRRGWVPWEHDIKTCFMSLCVRTPQPDCRVAVLGEFPTHDPLFLTTRTFTPPHPGHDHGDLSGWRSTPRKWLSWHAGTSRA